MEIIAAENGGGRISASREPANRRDRGRLLLDHPLAATALVAVPVAVGHAVWIVTHRRWGAFDPDEAGYLATSLSYHRALIELDAGVFVRAVAGTANGPVVPLLSVPFLLLGPSDPRTAMLVQPVLLVATAILVAALTRRLAGPVAALATGASCVALPTFSLATQSYWYGLGAAALTAAAALSLLCSERLTNRWTWVFGATVGLLPMTRTMMFGFVPGMFLGAAVLVWPDRRGLKRLVGAVGVAGVVAGPWFVANHRSILDYLLGYGYGPRAGLFGSGNLFDRIGFRIDRLAEGAGLGPVVGVALAIVAGVGAIRVVRRVGVSGLRADPRAREAAALAVPLIGGFAALVSTTNSGVWFELPLYVLGLPLIGAAVSRAFRPMRMAVVAGVAATMVGVASITWWWIPPRAGALGFGIIGAHYEPGMALYDPRFAPDRRDDAPAAAADWNALTRDVTAEVLRLDRRIGADGGTEVVFSGSMMMFNTNSVRLESERVGRTVRIRTPDTTVSTSRQLEWLTPNVGGSDRRNRPRIVLVALHDQHLFTPDARVRRFAGLARREGWEVADRIPMPDGGVVEILTHPGTRPA